MGELVDMTGDVDISGDDALALVGALFDDVEGVEISGADIIGALMEMGALDGNSVEIGARGGRAGGASGRGGGGRGGAGGAAVTSLLNRAKQKASAKKLGRAIIQDKFAKDAIAVKSAQPIDTYGTALNFRSTVAVPVGQTVEVIAEALEAFKPDEVSIPAEIGPDFLIQRVDVGMRKLFSSNAPLRASLLNNLSWAKRLFKNITIQRGQQTSFFVQNTGGADRFFEATLFGDVLLMG
jgi:hypothetical protein